MGTTNFPQGITSGGVTVPAVGSLPGTVITGSGTIAATAFGLTAATTALVSMGGTGQFAGTAVGVPTIWKSHCAAGAVVVRGYDSVGTLATTAGTVTIIAHGS